MNETAGAHHHGAWHGRIEDDPLVRGRGRFSDDVRPDGAAYACFVRSPHAFAEIGKVDAPAARRASGVLAVLTAADLAAAQFATVSAPVPVPGRGGVMVKWPHRPALAGERTLPCGRAGRAGRWRHRAGRAGRGGNGRHRLPPAAGSH